MKVPAFMSFHCPLSFSLLQVIIMLPLLPVFEGPLQGSALSSLMGVFYWQYRSLCRGGNSFLERLGQLVPDPNQYVHILGKARTQRNTINAQGLDACISSRGGRGCLDFVVEESFLTIGYSIWSDGTSVWYGIWWVSSSGLRTYTTMSNQSDELDSSFVTEQIYVGSKVLIVDDNKCIIGSAAINER